MASLISTNKPTSTKQPLHVYIPNVSIFDTCQFWKHVLPKKSYGIRQQSSNVVVATFNECVQVLRRLSIKCWPGPVTIYVQVQQPIPGLSITAHAIAKRSTGESNNASCYTSESNVQHYIAIRKPCHPLSRKVCTEFYNRSHSTSYRHHRNSNTSSCNTTPSASPVLSSTAAPILSSSSPPFMITPCRVSSCVSLSTSLVSSQGVEALLPEEANNNDDDSITDTTSKTTILAQQQGHDPQLEHVSVSRPQPLLLVGKPMICSKKKKHTNHYDNSSLQMSATECNCVEYVQSADRAVNAIDVNHHHKITAVLHGEERHEILSVPTCMYQEPYPTSIWIDSDARIVRIKSSNKKIPCHYHPTSSPDYLQEQQHLVDETSVLQSLRTSARKSLSPICVSQETSTTTNATKKYSSSNERVLHAVLLKWKVMTE
jgi:hypothetical protein